MILEAREKRFNLQRELVNKYQLPLVVLRINYPGNKNNFIVKTIYNLIDLNLVYVYKTEIEDAEGIVLIGIVDKDAVELKKEMISIEEQHPLGRLLDIDVYDNFFKQISRSDLGFENRKCLLCDDVAHYCIRSKKHTLKEVQNEIYNIFVSYMSLHLTNNVLQSLVQELIIINKPGLITPLSDGSHIDMDYDLMLKSVQSLRPGFMKMVKYAFDSDLNSCRKIGIEMENSMFAATGGVNTHKGGIFLMSALIFGFVKSLKDDLDWQSAIIESMRGISSEIKDEFYNSHGKDVYLKYGVLGIRGEAENGFSLMFDNLDNDYLKVLFKIMSKCDDTTILYRHNLEILNYVKAEANRILDNFDIDEIKKLDKEFIKRGISPGGSADLLGGVIFVNKIMGLLK